MHKKIEVYKREAIGKETINRKKLHALTKTKSYIATHLRYIRALLELLFKEFVFFMR
jgi:hypothetical protein